MAEIHRSDTVSMRLVGSRVAVLNVLAETLKIRDPWYGKITWWSFDDDHATELRPVQMRPRADGFYEILVQDLHPIPERMHPDSSVLFQLSTNASMTTALNKMKNLEHRGDLGCMVQKITMKLLHCAGTTPGGFAETTTTGVRQAPVEYLDYRLYVEGARLSCISVSIPSIYSEEFIRLAATLFYGSTNSKSYHLPLSLKHFSIKPSGAGVVDVCAHVLTSSASVALELAAKAWSAQTTPISVAFVTESRDELVVNSLQVTGTERMAEDWHQVHITCRLASQRDVERVSAADPVAGDALRADAVRATSAARRIRRALRRAVCDPTFARARKRLRVMFKADDE